MLKQYLAHFAIFHNMGIFIRICATGKFLSVISKADSSEYLLTFAVFILLLATDTKIQFMEKLINKPRDMMKTKENSESKLVI